MNGLILIKYGELTTKKGNRKFFIQTLEKNIRSILKKFNFEIEYDYVRMYIKCDENELEEIVKALQKVFGIHGIVICHKVNNKDEIFEIALKLLKESGAKTFKVETNRADKSFPIPSMEFSHQLGGYLLKNLDVKVDAVACYLALKRGVDVECLYFESPPHTSVEAKNKVLTLASILNEYSGHVKVHVIPFTKLQEEIYKNVDSEYVITVMRRMMYRIAEKVAHERKAKIIINGESIGQVASQTLSSLSVINAVTNMPVIRPVACMDKLEIISLAEKIGTYTTSILPYEDCCTIFLPKHPVIHPNLEKVLNFEKNFDFESLVDECVQNKETITSFENNEFDDLL